MDKKDILKGMKELLNFANTDEANTDEVNTDEVNTDGELGSKIPEEVLAELEGEYTLDNGLVITIDITGVITDVVKSDTEADTEADTETETEADTEADTESKVVQDQQVVFSKLEEKMNEMSEQINKLNDDKDNIMKFNNELVDKLSVLIYNTPATKELNSIKQEFSNMLENNKENRVSNLESIRKTRIKE